MHPIHMVASDKYIHRTVETSSQIATAERMLMQMEQKREAHIKVEDDQGIIVFPGGSNV